MDFLDDYFQKVDNFIDVASPLLHNFKIGQLIERYDSSGVILEYFLFEDLDIVKSTFVKNFCKIPPTAILYAHITGQGLLGAHIDHGTLTCLNFYISANEDRTIFFEKKDKHKSGELYPGKTEANIYDIEDLNPVGQFVACSNESYLLNVSKIHCVHKVNDSKRSFVNFAWNYHTYQEVLENLI